MTQPDHHYDTAGVCTLCNRCDDEHCCEQVPCDRQAWKEWDEGRHAMARAYFGDLP